MPVLLMRDNMQRVIHCNGKDYRADAHGYHGDFAMEKIKDGHGNEASEHGRKEYERE